MKFSDLSWDSIFKSVKKYFTASKKEVKDEDIATKKKAKRLLDYYRGDQVEYLKGHGFEDGETSEDLISKATLNITKKIIDKRSMVYKYPPTRTLTDTDNEELEKEPKHSFW